MSSTYYYLPGMMHPFWAVGDEVAHNRDADTDMGDFSVEEFTEMILPHAIRITEEQYDQGSLK